MFFGFVGFFFYYFYFYFLEFLDLFLDFFKYFFKNFFLGNFKILNYFELLKTFCIIFKVTKVYTKRYGGYY